MKILCLSQYFPPEPAAGGFRIAEMARRWVGQGHEVTVVTGFPNYPSGVVPENYRRRWLMRERLDGILVLRTWLVTRPNAAAFSRLLNYVTFCISAAITGCFTPRQDVVVATSPPLFVGLSGWAVSRVRGLPFVLDVRDLWPESFAVLGGFTPQSRLVRSVGYLARFLYRSAATVVVVSPAFSVALVNDWRVPAEKIVVIENGVETDMFRPMPADEEVREAAGIKDEFVIGYFGTIGIAHGLGTLLTVAERLRDTRPNIVFMLAGGGAESAHVVAQIRGRRLTNIRVLGIQSRDRMPQLISACEVSIVLLRKSDVFKTVIPTKLLEAMACGRPVVLGVEGQARMILQEANAGVCVEPENVDAIEKAILFLNANPKICREFGERGRAHVVRYFSRKTMSEHYLERLSLLYTSRASERCALSAVSEG